MKEIIFNGAKPQRCDQYISGQFPLIRQGALNKFVRQNKIKINGKKAVPAQKLEKCDVVSLYIDDEYFLQPNKDNAFMFANENVEILYEDDNLFVVNKPSGISVISDDWQEFDTLSNRIKHYYFKNGIEGYIPQLCHRIDTGTSGIVVLAKSDKALNFMFELFRDKQLKKKYICAVKNNPKIKDGVYKAFLTKNSKRGFVTISDKPLNNASQNIETGIKTLAVNNGYKLMDINLFTGRTHQIRAHMAHLGMPLLGDSKYGDNNLNRKLKLKYQLLCSCLLKFGKIDDKDFEYLSYKEIICPTPWFAQRFDEIK